MAVALFVLHLKFLVASETLLEGPWFSIGVIKRCKEFKDNQLI